MRRVTAAVSGPVVLAMTCGPAFAGAQDATWPLPHRPPVVMNTVSTLQYYGPTPGFHHGLDLVAPAGAEVVAPVSGRVETGHYYERVSDYTYEVAIVTASGERWELHHIDPDDVPDRIERIAAEGGSIEAGTPVGRIYDAAAMGIEPHLHVNVIRDDGRYVNPLLRLAGVEDRQSPVVAETWWARQDGGRFVEVEPHDDAAQLLIIDAYDRAPGSYWRQSIYALTVRSGDEVLWSFTFDVLPEGSFLERLDEIYLLDELHALDGTVVRSDPEAPRRFLYRVALPTDSRPRSSLDITISDAAGNVTRTEVPPPR